MTAARHGLCARARTRGTGRAVRPSSIESRRIPACHGACGACSIARTPRATAAFRRARRKPERWPLAARGADRRTRHESPAVFADSGRRRRASVRSCCPDLLLSDAARLRARRLREVGASDNWHSTKLALIRHGPCRERPCALWPFRPLARPARGHGPCRGPASGSGRRRMRAPSRALSSCAPHTERELSEAPPVRAVVLAAVVSGPPPARPSSSRMAAPSPRLRR